MFLRRYQRAKDGKRHAYFALVESQRTERGPRQRIVAQLGELPQDQERCWQRTAIFHTRNEQGERLKTPTGEHLEAWRASCNKLIAPEDKPSEGNP
jgi:hypothetical protein